MFKRFGVIMNPEIKIVKKMRRYLVFYQLDNEDYPSRKIIASTKMDVVQHFRRMCKGCHVKIIKIERVENQIHKL